MKKIWYFIILFIFCIILCPFIIRRFHREHHINYSRNGYVVKEDFSIIEKMQTYDFYVEKDNEKYIFSFLKNKSRKKKIIKKIEFYKEDNISCILPFIKGEKYSSLYCLENNEQVSNYLLKNNKNYLVIRDKVKKHLISEELEIAPKEYDNLLVYNHNIEKDEVYYIWDYKGIYVLTKENILYQKILDFDLYDQVMATTVRKNYVLFLNNSASGIDTLYFYNPDTKKLQNMTLEYKLAKDSYINGVRDDFIYVTDRRKKIQYRINIFKKEMEIIGNEEDKYITYQRGEKTLLNKSDFFMKNQLFDNDIVNDCIYHNHYDYCVNNNEIFMNRNEVTDKLLSINNITEWELYKDRLLILNEDILYSYNDLYGLKKIVEYRELHYNYSNIYKIGK